MTLLEKLKEMKVPARSIDIGLIAAAVFCFFVYGYLSSDLGSQIASGNSLGNIVDGNASRKSAGRAVFETIRPYAPIFNRDVLWIEDSDWSQLRFQDGSLLRMKHGTMLVITRSLNASNLGSRIELLKGEIEFDKRWHWFWQTADFEVISQGKKITIGPEQKRVTTNPEPTEPKKDKQALPKAESTAEPTAPPVPSPSPTLSPSPTPSHSPTPIDRVAARQLTFSGHPKPGSILLKGGSATAQANVAFAWPTPVTGTVEVKAVDGSLSQRASVKGLTSTKIPLLVEKEYEWAVHDASGQTVFGPFRFRLYSTAKHSLSQLMEKETQAVIEIAN